MLKNAHSFVLASLNASTYGTRVRFGISLAAALLCAFLSILLLSEAVYEEPS